MKKSAVLLCFFALPTFLFAQLTFNTEAVLYDDANETVGVGGTVQLDFLNRAKLRPGIKAGLLFDINSPENTMSYQVPVSLVLRRYILGRHSCPGGLYIEGAGGAGIYRQSTDSENVSSSSQEIRPQASVGLGLRLPILLDVAVSMGRTFDPEAISFIGLKANLRF